MHSAVSAESFHTLASRHLHLWLPFTNRNFWGLYFLSMKPILMLLFDHRNWLIYHVLITNCCHCKNCRQALKDHFVELLSMEAPEDVSTFVQPENEHPSLAAKSFWDVAAPSYKSLDAAQSESRCREIAKKGDSRKSTARSFNTAFAGLVLLIAVIFGSLFYAKSSRWRWTL